MTKGYKYELAHSRGYCIVCRSPWRRGDKVSRLIAKWVHLDCKAHYLRRVAQLEEAGRL